MALDKNKNRICNEFNETKEVYSKNQCIHELFEIQALKDSEKIAVIYEEKKNSPTER